MALTKLATVVRFICQRVHELKTLSSPPLENRTHVMTNTGRLLARLVDRLCAVLVNHTEGGGAAHDVAPSLTSLLSVLQQLLRQVCDEHGNIAATALLASGKGVLQGMRCIPFGWRPLRN